METIKNIHSPGVVVVVLERHLSCGDLYVSLIPGIEATFLPFVGL